MKVNKQQERYKKMAKLFINALIFGIAFQLTCYMFWAFSSFGGLIQYPFGNANEVANINSMFSLNLWSALVGGTGVVISIAALLLRQGTYALYAMLLFAIGVFFPIVSTFVLAIPNTIAGLASSMGLSAAVTGPFATFIGVICVFGGFMYVFGLVIQRDPM
jgi:hypothetical protein